MRTVGYQAFQSKGVDVRLNKNTASNKMRLHEKHFRFKDTGGLKVSGKTFSGNSNERELEYQ